MGVIWIVTAECVILNVCPPYLERDQLTYSIKETHFLCILPVLPLLFSYAISLRIPWAASGHQSGRADLVFTFFQKRRPVAFLSPLLKCVRESSALGVGVVWLDAKICTTLAAGARLSWP